MEQQAQRGDVIADRYELLERLGVGGSGEVFRARDRLLGDAEVAIKLLFRSLMASEAAVARFQNEAAITRELTHPGIVQVFDFGRTANGAYYLVMELVEGGTLRDLIQGHPQGVGNDLALELFSQLAEAIAVAHRFGVVHRDLKPENILIDSAGRARISDFGVAVDPGRVSALTASGDIVGTVDYMAPEQLAGGKVDARVDVFALGLIVCELLTGSLPWENGRSDDVLSRFSREALVMPQTGSSLPLPALNIIDRALEVDARRRWTDGDALSAALRLWRDSGKLGWIRRYLRSHIRIARLRRALRKMGTVAGVVLLLFISTLFFDRERLMRTTVLMLFERFTGVSTHALTQVIGVDAEYSEASMFRCAREGNQTCIRALLLAGISPNIVDADGHPLLNIVARQQAYFALQMVLPSGANIDGVDRNGRTVTMILLSSPSASGREVIAQYLAEKPDLLIRDWRGRTVLWYAAALGRVDLWELITQSVRDRYGEKVLTEELNRRDIDGLPLIHVLLGVGARSGPVGFLGRALQGIAGQVDLNATDAEGLTPLMRTRFLPWSQIQSRQSELLAAGADPEFVSGGRKLSPLPSEPSPQLEKQGRDFFLRERDSLVAY